MYLSNNLIVASLFVIASSFVNAAVTSPLTAVNSQQDFCLFLPPQPGLVVAVTENDGIPFCTKKDAVPKASEFPQGFITTAHYLKANDYVQVTGFFDRTKYSLGANDGGGQYDNHAKGKPVHAQCKDYKYFVSLVEPDIERFCIRCCNDKTDCNTGRSGYGCLRVVPGDYTRDNNFGSNNGTATTHQNYSIDSVYADLDALPEANTAADANTDSTATTEKVDTAADATTTTEKVDAVADATTSNNTTTVNANQEIAAEIETLKTELSNSNVDQVQTKWTQFATKLSTDYPQVSEQIKQLSTITASLNTSEQWNAFIDLVSKKIIQLQATSTTADDEASTASHTDSKEDLEWLFNHRNSHDNQATW
ncbi:hypothetical protein MFLAVUS_009513 [Mucor flavus]|uniref:Uncharacterized protein n=1 Tax=Mucor flavus TaxID=439312 RepID=A0ABP9ZAB6_9FUNG